MAQIWRNWIRNLDSHPTPTRSWRFTSALRRTHSFWSIELKWVLVRAYLIRSVRVTHIIIICICNIYQTRQDDANPAWNSFTEPLKKFCNADEDRTLEFVCWDEGDYGPKLIGKYTTTLKELRVDFRNKQPRNLINQDSKRTV